MFIVMKIRPGIPFPDCVVDWCGFDSPQRARDAAYSAGHQGLADFFYRTDAYPAPGDKLRIPIPTADGTDYWMFGCR